MAEKYMVEFEETRVYSLFVEIEAEGHLSAMNKAQEMIDKGETLKKDWELECSKEELVGVF